MTKDKQKVQLSEQLKLGVAGPAPQGMLFKFGGVLFLFISVILIGNIYLNVRHLHALTPGLATSTQPEVLGAYDDTTAPQPQMTSYTIVNGDTLFDIAQNHSVNWQLLATINNLNPPYTLKPGTILKLPVTVK